MVRALDFVAAALDCVPSDENVEELAAGESAAISADDAATLLRELRSVRSMLSDCVHTVAHGVTLVQKKRDKALQTAVTGDEFDLEEELDEESADWVIDTSALHARAKAVRAVRKDLKGTNFQPRSRPNGTRRGGGGGRSQGGPKNTPRHTPSGADKKRNDANTAAQKKKAAELRAQRAAKDKVKGAKKGADRE